MSVLAAIHKAALLIRVKILPGWEAAFSCKLRIHWAAIRTLACQVCCCKVMSSREVKGRVT
eukprot:scaffold237014_cov15-Tisochrysis_lutea.AAC.1